MDTVEEQTPVSSKVITVGHTPDADDAFMFYGFAKGEVSIPDHSIKHVVEEIEKLNQMSMRQELDMTAISAAIYPLVQSHYWILPVGASVGRNYGPVIVKRAGEKPSGKLIGIPGQNTTAALLLRLLTKGYQPLEYKFDKIPDALKSGDIDYGLLIHEAQISFGEMGFEKVADLGEMWMNETNLPIPLGLDIIKKSLNQDLAREVGRAFQKSIMAGQKNPEAAVEYALQYGRGMGNVMGRNFIEMYVNEDTLSMSEDTTRALSLLFDKGYREGIFPKPTRLDILAL